MVYPGFNYFSPGIISDLQVFNHHNLTGSDHVPQIIYYLHSSNHHLYNIQKWKYHKTNWDVFFSFLNSLPLTEVSIKLDTNFLIKQFTGLIITTANSFSTKTNSHLKQISVPWWSLKCSLTIKARRKALKKLKDHSNLENHINFQKCRAHARYTLKQSKKKSWHQFIQSIDLLSISPSKVWKKIRSLNKRTPFSYPSSIIFNDKIISQPLEIANIFVNFLSQPSSDWLLNSQQKQFKLEIDRDFLDFNARNDESYNSPNYFWRNLFGSS